MNLYLLLQISLRKNDSVGKARTIGAISTRSIGIAVEVLQYPNIDFWGSTYDPLDIIMYAPGIIFGLVIDWAIIGKFERNPRSE